MKIIKTIFIIFIAIGIEVSVSVDENTYVVLEGKGIENVALLEDSIKNVETFWGKADRVAKEEREEFTHYAELARSVDAKKPVHGAIIYECLNVLAFAAIMRSYLMLVEVDRFKEMRTNRLYNGIAVALLNKQEFFYLGSHYGNMR